MKKAEGKSPKSEVRGQPSRFTFHVSRPPFQAASHTSHHSHSPRLPVWLLAVLLVLVTLALYWPTTGFGFINYDDPTFVTANTHVQGGLSWEGVKWAFGLNGGDYWHPLTWLSLMLDASLFGQRAGGFHFTNVAFHAVNGALLFLLLRMLTGAVWRSVVVAALFALHPLRVESVAWVAERKDVLSGCFGLLALICYARYARGRMQHAESGSQQPTPPLTFHVSRFTFHVSPFYLLSLCFFACGLMSKAMLVTWPFVMLLLDYWPLKRMQNAGSGDPQPATRPPLHVSRFTFHASRPTFHVSRFTFSLLPLLFEKIPFFVLSGISCVLTYLTEGGQPEESGFEASPTLLRFQNALVAYGRYVGKTFWPVNLAVPYMNPGHWSWLELGGSMLLVVGAFIAVLWLGRRRPYLLVGWCWFWGALIPVIGLTRGWGSFMADRFTYLPSIGLMILPVWGAYELIQGKAAGGVEREERQERGSVGHALARSTLHAPRFTLILLSVAGGAAIVLCLALTRHQLGYWQDSETLFRHVIEATENNHVAYNNLAQAVLEDGQIDQALGLYLEAIRLKPDYAVAHNNLGVALDQKGQTDEAIRHFQKAIHFKPDYAAAYNNLGGDLNLKGQIDEGIGQLQAALRLRPDYADAHNNLGIALGLKGQIDQAIYQYQEALRLKPDHAEAHYNLGAALDHKGQTDEAIRHYQEALRLKPDAADVHSNLGIALGKRGQTDEAIRHYQEALRLKPGYAEAHNNLGIAFYQQGRKAEAIQQFQEALRLKPDYADARRNLEAVLAAKADSSPPPGLHPQR